MSEHGNADASGVEQLRQRARTFLEEAIETALDSGDKDRRELAAELAAGRITPKDAVVNLGYQDVLESGCRRDTDAPPAEKEGTSGATSRAEEDEEDEDFSTHTVLRYRRNP
ncbi:hypothetical protein SAMN05421810_108163 [Amycolatopsis arida]|uniref:Uncharacterized protein n=1 Tax=Amycolatopsis arida TaxID=587909 RepID=A0A1I5Z2M6_9PSEU|nr:hypothetical protein [Amycolatopsis arida]TDX90075.1 hypothetical protein CLV69_108163 [Amycolatopsis arida]SFQ50719.1 hypothetical protein SAMN05421810_108163 [Amycolatopsis arida]